MRLTAIPRLTVGLVTIAVGLLLLFDLVFRLFPSEVEQAREARVRVANALAIQVAALVQSQDWRAIERTLAAVQTQDPDIDSIGLRSVGGALKARAGDHAQRWRHGQRDSDALSVNLLVGGDRWGALEVAFKPLLRSNPSLWLLSGPMRMLLLFTLVGGALYFLYLRSMLLYLDPSAAVPDRVRGAFDALSEGVLIVDSREQVLLANRSAMRLAGCSSDADIIGRSASALTWLQATGKDADPGPWRTAMRSGEPLQGRPFQVRAPGREPSQVVIHCSPLRDERGSVRGCLVTLDDVTELQRSHTQLLQVLADLASSKKELESKNSELETLASRDPLSGCLNRRAFYARFASLLLQAREQELELVCIMADIDHFKSINDRFGHPVGDDAIKCFADVLRGCVRADDLVGRYGGEEFCIVLAGVRVPQAMAIAENMRERLVAARGVGAGAGHDVRMSASFGVSALSQGAADEAQLIDEADRALYLAKQGGRNRVVYFSAPRLVETSTPD